MFEFRTHARTIAGAGSSDRLAAVITTQWGASRILVLTDRPLRALGLPGKFATTLREGGHDVEIFSDVIADPPEATIDLALQAARSHCAQLIVGFGGGSSMDVAKLVAALAEGSTDIRDVYGMDKISWPRLPLIQVPTTAGTGSEATPIAIVTRSATVKAGIVSPALYADIAVLDPLLTLGLPSKVTAATGVDAMVHAIEAYTSRIHKNPVSDSLAREALRLLYHSLERVCREGQDISARQNMLIGAMMAGQAFANAPVGGIHALAYPLGGIFHVPHGLSNALMLKPVLRFNLSHAATQYAELAEVILPSISDSPLERAHAFVDTISRLAEAVGLETRLAQVGVTTDDLATLAEQAMLQQRLLVNNPRGISYKDAYSLYEEAL
ncbi:iron-containing alcohol dehydrogenase [Pollutimonas bauzanensis]|uniref:Alcohol dehydrogenase, class IV n=1 Tax=Pollutimonas bauzanensis TaxID=658167 RepID=A0A1M5SDJ7_9BURK|nr:Alcohol dehydrogenase, class IV [Pollutimonas bauzanensis]